MCDFCGDPDHNVFKDLEYMKKKMRELQGPEPIGLKFFPDGHWELWYGEMDGDN